MPLLVGARRIARVLLLSAAAGKVLAAIAAARSLTFRFPIAICLETAALVCLRPPGTAAGVVPRLLGAAMVVRDDGDRPGPVTLSAAVAKARAAVAARPEPGLDAAVDLAITTLSQIAVAGVTARAVS